MSSDHQQPIPPNTSTVDIHRHPPSPTTSNTLFNFTNQLLKTPSPMKPTTTINSSETNPISTPESRLAAAIGHAAAAAAAATTSTNPLLRTLSDADSSANQTITTSNTPPKVPRNNPLRRTLSDSITSDYQLPQKTPRVSSSPQSSTGKQSPQSQVVLKKVEDMVKEIEQRCWEIMREEEHVAEENNHQQEQDECVGVERLKNGDLRFELSCACGKRFEMVIKHNGYSFYRLT
ncbi:hypothetical protein QVD17_40723 [Tagetes erecta]|uniref:Uncharacterized protein n=1 Tax=Tagetes erecta TaxID=13708 RepID=A0AAD8JU36_TARER|nr:hypothetical protein QVD17_40723 [Tagetes erecta]